MVQARVRTVVGSALVHSPVELVFSALIDPREQLRWNSLYLQAALTTPGEIVSGSVMTGRFRGSGRSRVTFADVRFGEQFTHESVMRIGQATLGRFRHTYRVRPVGAGTEVTQQVRFEPAGLGRLVSSVIVVVFRLRLPASFRELDSYLRTLT